MLASLKARKSQLIVAGTLGLVALSSTACCPPCFFPC